MNVNIGDIKIITTPLLGAGIKISDLAVKLPDNSLLLSADQIKARISIPSLFLMTELFSDENKNLTLNIDINTFLPKTEAKLIKYSGEVQNYYKLDKINFLAQGALYTGDLIQLIGKEFKPFIHSQGAIPVKLTSACMYLASLI